MAGDRRYKKDFFNLLGDFESDQTAQNNDQIVSSPINVFDFNRALMTIELQSHGAPTSIQFYIEVSPNQGGTWYPILNDFLSTLTYNAASCVTRLYAAYDFYMPGALVRVRAVPAGCSGANYFDFKIGLLGYVM